MTNGYHPPVRNHRSSDESSDKEHTCREKSEKASAGSKAAPVKRRNEPTQQEATE